MIEEKDLERLKEIFVTRKECRSNMDSTDRKFANDDKRLAVIEAYQKIQLGVMSAIGVGVLGLVLKQFWG